MTYDERFEQIEGKVDELLKIVRPQEETAEPDSSKMILDELGGISNEVDMLIDEIKSVRKDVQTALEQPFEPTEGLSEADEKFNIRRNIFALGGLVATGALSLAFWFYFLPMFAVAVGLFFAFGMLALALAYDEYILPGNTIKRIAQNAIAAAIILSALIYIIGTGIQVGNSLITNRSGSEEYKAPTFRERTVERANTGDTEE